MDWMPQPYEDETLYSVLARLARYMGQPNTSAFSRALSGGRHWVALTQFPCQLGSIAKHFRLNDAAVDTLIDNHTLLPFYTAYTSQALRDRARQAMRGSTDGLQLMLGIAASPIPTPTHLRFCPNCLEDMYDMAGEAWWRRIHQLPGVEVCAIHAAPLCNSIVEISRSGRHALVPADRNACVARVCESVPSPGNLRACERVAGLARAAASMLVAPPVALTPVEHHKRIAASLSRSGLLRGTRHVLHEALLKLLRDYWGEALDQIPGMALISPDGTSWVSDHVRNKRKLAHPLRHAVIDMALAAAAAVEQPFGLGPWPCLNPISDHFQMPTIQSFRKVRDRGKLHGHFTCRCGYAYSRTVQRDGRVSAPHFRSFGPTLAEHVRFGLQANRSLRALSREARIDPKTLVREARLAGVAMPWALKA